MGFSHQAALWVMLAAYAALGGAVYALMQVTGSEAVNAVLFMVALVGAGLIWAKLPDWLQREPR